MKQRVIVLLSVFVLLSLVIAPVGTVGAQVEDQGVAPDCPPFDLASARDQDFLKSLSPDCAKTYRELMQRPDNETSIVDVTPSIAGGPDDFGYTFNDTVSYGWISASTGSGLTGDDNDTGPFNIGFSFPFYGINQTQLYLSTNGLISFGAGYWGYGGDSIPSPASPNNFIAPFWEDLLVGSTYNSGGIYYLQGGIAPNRYFVIEWRNIETWPDNSASPFSFEAILHENGDIVFQLQSLPATYYSTVGIENSLGNTGLEYQSGSTGLSAPRAIRFYYPAPAARVFLSPPNAGMFSTPNGTSDFTMNVANTGGLGTDTFDLTTSSTWPVTLYAANGITPLTDTDTDAVIDTGPISQGATINIIARVATPSNAQTGDDNQAIVTATSSLNVAVSKTANLQTGIPSNFTNVFQANADGAMSFMTAKAAGTNFYKATADNYYGSDVAVTKLGNNNYLYVWSKNYYTGSYSVNEIEYAIFAPNGAIVRPPTRLTDNSSAVMTTRNYVPSVSVAPNGTVGLAWRHYFFNSSAQYNQNIYFATLDSSGNLLTGPFNVTNNLAWGTPNDLNVPQYNNPAVAAADDNNFILGWTESLRVGPSVWQWNIWYATRTSSGTSLFGPAKLTSDNDSWSPILNPLTGGKVILTWNSASVPYYAVINSNGSVYKPATFLPGTATSDIVDAILLPSGKVGVAWTTLTGVQLAVLNSSYNLESGPTSASNPSNSEGYGLSMTTDSSGRLIMTWIDWASQNLHYALGDSSGTFLTPPMYYKSSSDYIDASINGQGVAPIPDVTISGNAGVAGVTLSYTDGTPKTVTADGSGNYSITVPAGWTGTITPSLNADAFCPAGQNYNNLRSNWTMQHYAHAACPNFGNVTKWTNAFDLSHGWTVADYVRTVGDVNGDGKADAVGFGLDGVYVSLSTGSNFGPVSKWTSSFDLSHGWTVKDYVRTVGDVSGDGKADLVGFGLDGVYVATSTGSGFNAVSKWTSAFDLSHGWTVSDFVRTVGDVNGDGKADLVGFGLDGVYVSLSTGSSFPAPTRWTSAFDLSHGWTVSQFVRTVGDVDGDNMADLVGFGLDGVYVATSTGSGFNAVSKWTGSFALANGWTVAQYVRTLADVNGDGRVDIVGFGQDGVYIGLSTGTTFSLPSRRTTSFDLSHAWTVSQYVRTVGDVNSGDGKADLVGFGLDGVYIALAQ